MNRGSPGAFSDNFFPSGSSGFQAGQLLNSGGSGFANKNADLDKQIALLKSCECIKESEVRDLCNMARDILLEESNIQNISSPITICGDIHG